MGLFWEVPVMLGLVCLCKHLRTRAFWKHADERYDDGRDGEAASAPVEASQGLAPVVPRVATRSPEGVNDRGVNV